MAHALFALNHASDVVFKTDYQDEWDVMSGAGTYYSRAEPAFAETYGYDSNPEKYVWGQGPGYSSAILDSLGWLDATTEDRSLLNQSCATSTITLDPLSTKTIAKGHFVSAQLPYTNGSGRLPGLGYTVEFRSWIQGSNYTVWDGNVPETVLVHIIGATGAPFKSLYPSFLVDTAEDSSVTISGADLGGVGGTPEFVAGATYADLTSSAYVAVNQIKHSTTVASATVTLGTCPFKTKVAYSGSKAPRTKHTFTFAADLTTQAGSGPAAPAPYQTVTFTMGRDACTAFGDVDGHATCGVTVATPAGASKIVASFAGNTPYESAATSVNVTVSK
jgi:hypothetical protein